MNSYLKNISKERPTTPSCYSKDSEAYLTGPEESTGSFSIKSKLTSAYRKCVEYIAHINKGYNQEIILESVDQATKENIYRYVKSLNLDLHEQREEGTETLVTIDITPLGHDQQGMHDLLVFLENEKLKLDRKREKKRSPQCEIKEQHRICTSTIVMPSMERVPSLSPNTISSWHSPAPSESHDTQTSISSAFDNASDSKLSFSSPYMYDAGAGDYQRVMEPLVETKIDIPSPDVLYYRPLRLPKLKCYNPVETCSSMTQTSGTSIAISATARGSHTETKKSNKRRSIFSCLKRKSRNINKESRDEYHLKKEEGKEEIESSTNHSMSRETTGEPSDFSTETLKRFHTEEVQLALFEVRTKMSGGNVHVTERTGSQGSVIIELDETRDDPKPDKAQQKSKSENAAGKKRKPMRKGDIDEEYEDEEDEVDEEEDCTSAEDESTSSSWTSSTTSSSSSESSGRKPDAMFTATVRTPGKGKRWSDQGLKQPAPRRYPSRSDTEGEDSLSKELIKQKTEIQEIKSTMEEMMKIIKDMRDNKFAR